MQNHRDGASPVYRAESTKRYQLRKEGIIPPLDYKPLKEEIARAELP